MISDAKSSHAFFISFDIEATFLYGKSYSIDFVFINSGSDHHQIFVYTTETSLIGLNHGATAYFGTLNYKPTKDSPSFDRYLFEGSSRVSNFSMDYLSYMWLQHQDYTGQAKGLGAGLPDIPPLGFSTGTANSSLVVDKPVGTFSIRR